MHYAVFFITDSINGCPDLLHFQADKKLNNAKSDNQIKLSQSWWNIDLKMIWKVRKKLFIENIYN